MTKYTIAMDIYEDGSRTYLDDIKTNKSTVDAIALLLMNNPKKLRRILKDAMKEIEKKVKA
jgi:ribosomal protein S7